MANKQIAVLPFTFLLLLTWFSASGVSRGAATTKALGDIRQVDFKNFTYVRPECEKEKGGIPLRDGKHADAGGAETMLMRVTYGDLAGDVGEEAIVLLRGQNSRVSRTRDEVFIYALKGGQVVALAHFEGGRRGEYILSIASLGSNFKVEDRLLILDQAILREGEDVPTQYYTIKYRWNGIQMAEVERSPLKPIPENMLEIG